MSLLCQIWDVLFATSSMSAVLIHHYPLQRETRSALSLALLAFLVSPVSNSPTDALCIALAMGGGAVFFVVFWLRFWLQCRYGGNTWWSSGVDPATLYHEVNGMEPVSASRGGSGSVSGRGRGDGGRCNSAEEGLMMTMMMQSSARDSVGDVDTSSAQKDVHSHTRSSSSEGRDCFLEQGEDRHDDHKFGGLAFFDQCFTCHHCCPNVFLSLVGAAMVVTAFACYIFQNRETYWVVHSVWHVLAMGSTFLFIANKDSVVGVLSRTLYQSERPMTLHELL